MPPLTGSVYFSILAYVTQSLAFITNTNTENSSLIDLWLSGILASHVKKLAAFTIVFISSNSVYL
jgi:hypothetical protein